MDVSVETLVSNSRCYCCNLSRHMLVLQTKLNSIYNLVIYVVGTADPHTHHLSGDSLICKKKMSMTHIVYISPNAFLICSWAKDKMFNIIGRKHIQFPYKEGKVKLINFFSIPFVLSLRKLQCLPIIWIMWRHGIPPYESSLKLITFRGRHETKTWWCLNEVCKLDAGVF